MNNTTIFPRRFEGLRRLPLTKLNRRLHSVTADHTSHAACTATDKMKKLWNITCWTEAHWHHTPSPRTISSETESSWKSHLRSTIWHKGKKERKLVNRGNRKCRSQNELLYLFLLLFWNSFIAKNLRSLNSRTFGLRMFPNTWRRFLKWTRQACYPVGSTTTRKHIKPFSINLKETPRGSVLGSCPALVLAGPETASLK